MMSHNPDIDDLMEQIECSTIIKENMEGRLNGWLVKYAAMKDDRDTWQKRAEFSYQERNKLEKQRDELLAAMRKAVVAAAHPFNEARNECYNILDEAIYDDQNIDALPPVNQHCCNAQTNSFIPLPEAK